MRRREFSSVTLCGAALLPWPLRAAGLSEIDAAGGVRAALERGATAAVALLGRPDGFLGNPKVRIALPGFLDSAARLLRATGQQNKVEALITAMNRAAEAAVPQARTLLVQTARSISVEDALQIVRGSDTAVTEFFERKTRAPLVGKFLPIVAQATRKVALADKFNAVAGKAAQVGLMRGEDADLERYVTRKSLDGLYLMIGEEERKIRRDPLGTGSAILRRVFAR